VKINEAWDAAYKWISRYGIGSVRIDGRIWKLEEIEENAIVNLLSMKRGEPGGRKSTSTDVPP
jgi:hypothetical protein